MKGTASKFKVGDKIRILPKAVDWNVPKDEVGKLGVIKQGCYKELRVYMDNPWKIFNTRETWVVHPSHIELVLKPGQQLMFSFMSDVNGIQEEGE